MPYIPEGARWYIADLVLEFTIENDPRNVVHVNTVLVEADSPEQAYQKAIELGQDSALSYLNTDGGNVQIIFRGLRDLNVIHDDLENGAELIYEEAIGLSEDDLARWIKPKNALSVFASTHMDTNTPNYMPEDVMNLIRKMKF